MKKFLLFITTVFLSFLFLSGFTTLAESETIDGETYFNDYFNYSWDFYKFDLTDMDINLLDTYTNLYYFRINVSLPDNALIDGINTPFAIYSFNGYKLKYGDIIQTEQRYNIHSVQSGTVIRVNISINGNSIDDYLEENNVDPQDQLGFYTAIASYINQYFVAYYAKTDTYDVGYNDGYDDGYDVGYNDGKNDGYNEGYDEGYNEGYNEGKNDGYNEGYDEGYNEGYEDGRIIVTGRAPDNDYNFNNFGEPIIDTAYANRLYYSTGLGRVPVISNELFVGYNNTMIATFYGVFFYDSTGNSIGSIIINCGNTSSCENTEGYGEKFNYMANSIDFAYNFAVYLDKYDIDYENVEFVKLEFITKNFPTAQWHEHFKNDLYFSFNYEHSFLRINLYQQGYNDGYEEGERVGSGIATREAFELGYETGYKEALENADVDAFLANFDKWIVPAIIVVIIAGIFVGYRRERYGGD